ncbi:MULTISPECIES: Cna B-type domain-containing protein [unclassified Enterococcus]|uniref:Cna B-type domain-containing protein n=1 Tax=unclassified Enterococcus TaxID=2608891 RepID=UPI001552C9C1|nr:MULTISPECIES: Cna B-type domain-containing protein [unclassified Enterococcus]MBS7576983.1 Cna B-type domain-containing protein [Enterococcus sp. MMGLQ5-2]MBS7584570.1 Cna B-type domain-containing protein [Enterococcus sp. MMGLQ5-1]NPD12425.1 Cna B-type domain-containing protein [Enterococcus sp. MMGLQ5-1]NPD36817.1 Cna B-type domain-containing protein [Enterococcus sp. MMGLQ5-2]
MKKKLSTYLSLFILLASFLVVPLAALAETVTDNPAIATEQTDTTEAAQTAQPPVQQEAQTQDTQTSEVKASELPISEPVEEEQSQENQTATQYSADSNGSYIVQITDANTQKPPYYGGEIINLYNGVSVSGSTLSLAEGSYTVISLPKDSYDKPSASGVSTSFDTFKALEIKETDTDWQIITTYKTLVGGYSADTPFKVNLTGRKVINNTEHVIKQAFYTADNQLLANSEYSVVARATIETPYSANYNVERLTKEVDSDYVVKDGQTFVFSTNNLGFPSYNNSDPRDRRVIATIPDGTKIKEGSDWIKVPDTDNQYYKDIARDQLNTTTTSIELDLSGMDLSSNDATNKSKAVRVSFSIQPVVDGVVQTDIPAKSWYVARNFYILKKEPEQPTYPVSSGMYTSNSFTFIDDDYVALKTGSSLYVPVDGEDLKSKGRQTQQVVNYHWINYKKNDTDPEKFIIKTSQMNVSNYINPTQLKINLIGLSSENLAKMNSKLSGTKVYGVKSDGTKVLLSDDITAQSSSAINDSFNKSGWLTFASGNYRSIIFEYPNDGLEFDKSEYDAGLYKSIYTSVVGDVSSQVSEDLKKQLPNAPRINQYDSASTVTETQVHANATDDTMTKLTNSHTSGAYEYYFLQYDSIQRYYGTSITNGSAFYTDDTISVSTSYSHTRNGNAIKGVTPKNLNIYYLVPDGLDPIMDSDNFESIKTVPAYAPGYNLIIAKPKKIEVPSNLDVITQTTTNYYTLSFKVNSRLPIGSYVIRSAIAIDNNKFNANLGTSSGIIQYDTPSGVWANITTNADNRSDNTARYTDLSYASFNIYPNKVLVAYKSVKLASESDDNYASSLGSKGKIGSDINYQLKLVNNSTRDIDSISLIDKLPQKGDTAIAPNDKGEYPARNSLFSTPLTGPVTSDNFDIYYSTDVQKESIEDTKNMNWVSSVSDYSKVTAVKAVLKAGQVIKAGATTSITLSSKIENSASISDGDSAYNSFAYSLNDGKVYIEALSSEIPVNYDKKDVLLNKIDQNHPETKLAHAIFDLYEKDGDKKVLENLETNADGQAVLKSLIIGKDYYLKEVAAPDGYNKLESPIYFTVTEALDSIDVTNVKDENINISGTKTWDDHDNQDGDRPDKVTVNLLANGEQVESTEVSEATEWQYGFSNLPKYYDGKEIVYTITEDSVKDYNTTIDGFNVINTHTPGETSVTVTKNWVDDQNIDQIRPDSIKVQLFANGQKYGEQIELNDANQWTTTWNHLPLKSDGKEIEYKVEEEKVEGYQTTIDDTNKGNILITNTREASKRTINGTKIWDDSNDKAGKRPDSIVVNLLANGQKVTQQTVKADKNGKWQFEFKDLPKFDNGKQIEYTVTEKTVENYQATVNGFEITNKYTGQPEKAGLPTTNGQDNGLLTIVGLGIIGLFSGLAYVKRRKS